MKRIASMALMICLGVAAVYAQRSVNMTSSGTSGASAVNLQQPNTSNDEDNFAGTGTLGQFTVRQIRAISNSPTPSSTCSGPSKIYFLELAGGAVFRFQDGSLLTARLTQGSDCIDFSELFAHCTLVLQITGGTGRFQNATGTLTFTEAVAPTLFDTSNNPVFFFSTGAYTGTISGVGMGEAPQEVRP